MMEKMEVVGTRSVDFKDDNGRQVSGLSLYYLMQSDGVDGRMAGKMFVSAQRLPGLSYLPKPGDHVMVNYDRYGRPVEFSPAK